MLNFDKLNYIFGEYPYIVCVGLNNKGHAFAHNVLKTGKLIYDANPDKRIKFAVKVISYYCDFQLTIEFLNKYYFGGYRRRLRAI